MNHFEPKSDLSRCGHMARRGPRLKQKGESRAENHIFYYFVRVRVREKRKRRAKGFFLRSTEFHWLEFFGLRTKVHLIGEGYVWVLKTWDFAEDPSEEFGKSKVSGLGSVHKAS